MIPAQYIDEHNSPNNIAFIKYAKNCNTSPLLKTRNETKIIPIPICHFSIFSDMNIEIFPPVTVHHTAACLLSQKYQHLDQHLHFSIFVKTLLFFFLKPKFLIILITFFLSKQNNISIKSIYYFFPIHNL